MAPGNAYSTYTVDSIDWGKYSTTVTVMVDEMTKFGYSVEEASRAFGEINKAFGDAKEDRERKQRAVKAMRPFMDLLTDPKVMFLRRWIDVERPLYVDGSTRGPGEYMDVDPNWLVTIGVAVNIETREIEFWASSPTSTLCWFIDPVLHGSIDHLTTASVGIFTASTLEAKWIEVLADLAESDGDFRFTNDPDPFEPTEREKDAVKRGRDQSLAELLRDVPVADQWDWAKPEDWQRQPQPPPFTPGSPPGTYTVTSTSNSNFFSTLMDSVTSAPEPETLTIEKMMDLSKQLKDAKENRNKNKFFSIMDINTTA